MVGAVGQTLETKIVMINESKMNNNEFEFVQMLLTNTEDWKRFLIVVSRSAKSWRDFLELKRKLKIENNYQKSSFLGNDREPSSACNKDLVLSALDRGQAGSREKIPVDMDNLTVDWP